MVALPRTWLPKRDGTQVHSKTSRALRSLLCRQGEPSMPPASRPFVSIGPDEGEEQDGLTPSSHTGH